PIPLITEDIFGNAVNNPPTIGCANTGGGFAVDATVLGVLTPVFPVSGGVQDFLVQIKNSGSNALTSVDVSVDVNGTVETINWTGSLNPCDTVSVLFDGANQVTLANGKNDLKIYTSNPNAGTDLNMVNDTLFKSFCTPMAGTYSID